MNLIITFVILIFSAIVHEVSHGIMAEKLGDDTAREQGRITLNPIPHIDPYGTILLPLFMWFATGGRFFFGAAKPVPVNFNNLRNPRSGMALVSLAGPASNFLLAILFVIPIKLGFSNTIAYPILLMGIYINILLGTFNLIPIPPLDGSKILVALAPRSWMNPILSLERYGFVLVMIFVLLGWFGYILWPVVIFFWQIFHLSLGDLVTVLGG
jgi:Zn-dependent protease